MGYVLARSLISKNSIFVTLLYEALFTRIDVRIPIGAAVQFRPWMDVRSNDDWNVEPGEAESPAHAGRVPHNLIDQVRER